MSPERKLGWGFLLVGSGVAGLIALLSLIYPVVARPVPLFVMCGLVNAVGIAMIFHGASSSESQAVAPEIQGIALFMHRSKHNMFDLRVAVLVHDETAFRDEWELDVVLANGDLVGGMRGAIAEHSLRVGTYALTVSFPFGARIPDLASLANASVKRLSGIDAHSRKVSYPPRDTPAIPLLPWQHEEPYPVGTLITPGPGISVEITKEARWNTPNSSPGLTPFLWGLKIRNDGVAADFQAWAELKTGSAPLAPAGRHRLSFRDGVKARIFEGAEDRLFFAVVYWTSIYSSVIAKALWYFDEQERCDTESQLFPAPPESTTTSASAVVAELEVTIASEPSMATPWKRRYRLGPDNELHDVTP